MYYTIISLIAAHLVADFLLQSDAMVKNKKQPKYFVAHLVVIVSAHVIITGNANIMVAGIVVIAHGVIDYGKIHLEKYTTNPIAFFSDQALHLAVLLIVASLFPNLYTQGWWNSSHGWVPAELKSDNNKYYITFLAICSSLVMTTTVGGIIVRLVVECLGKMPPDDLQNCESDDAGIEKAGQLIGYLERGLMVILWCFGQPSAIGFIFAAKSVLRLKDASRSQTEYIIVGSLASLLVAVAVGSVTIFVIKRTLFG